MNNPDHQSVYYCDFQTPDGSRLLNYHPVKFAEKPTEFVSVGGVIFKKIWELKSRVVYVRVSVTDLSFQVTLNG